MASDIQNAKALAIDRSFSGGADLDTSIAMEIQYIGSEASGTVEIGTGDFTFKHGDLAAEAVDCTIDSGGDDAGVIDISDTTADTIGEIADLINGSANWRCFLKGALRDDASANLVATLAATQAKVAAGIPIYMDGSDGIYSVAITGHDFKTTSYKADSDDGAYTDEGCVNGLAYWSGTVSETGGATVKVYEASQSDTTSTAKELYSAAIADATESTIGDAAAHYSDMLYASDENKRLIVRWTAATSLESQVAFNLRGCCVDLRRGRVVA